MTITEQEKIQHLMVGEATVDLIFKHQEVTLSSLIEQLSTMANREQDDDRLLNIWQVRKWLLAFSRGMTSTRRPDWLDLLTSRIKEDAAPQNDSALISGRHMQQ